VPGGNFLGVISKTVRDGPAREIDSASSLVEVAAGIPGCHHLRCCATYERPLRRTSPGVGCHHGDGSLYGLGADTVDTTCGKQFPGSELVGQPNVGPHPMSETAVGVITSVEKVVSWIN
jgi:hypothetical protein